MFLLSNRKIGVRVSSNKGRGVWALSDLPPGTIVGDYLGKVMWDSDIKALEASRESACFYDMAFGPRTSVLPDPGVEGPHLLNHSCEPNCEIFRFRNRSLMVSTRKILASEELTWDYGISIAFGGSTPEKYKCLCETFSCRGTMLTLPVYSAAWQNYWREGKEEALDEETFIGQELLPLDEYPELVPDHEIFQLHGSAAMPPLEIAGDKLPPYSALRRLMRDHGRRVLLPAANILVLSLWQGRLFCRDSAHVLGFSALASHS